jgi:hypothetical protein
VHVFLTFSLLPLLTRCKNEDMKKKKKEHMGMNNLPIVFFLCLIFIISSKSLMDGGKGAWKIFNMSLRRARALNFFDMDMFGWIVFPP